jgi:hypothetical protein
MLIWLRKEFMGVLDMAMTFMHHKMLGISEVTVQLLASQELISSVELVIIK